MRVRNMALSVDGRKPYVTFARLKSVAIVGTQRNAKIGEIAVGQLPWGVVVR